MSTALCHAAALLGFVAPLAVAGWLVAAAWVGLGPRSDEP